jgi:hypothetical protein
MKWRTRSVATIDVDGIEVELEGNPDYYDPEILQPTPTSLVVGYLLQDSDCPNPMEDWDGEGKLYTTGEGVITDDRAAPAYLGLNSFPSRGSWRRSGFEMDYDLELDGINERVAEKLKVAIKADPVLVAWITASVMETGAPYERVIEDLVDEMQGYRYTNYDWSSDEDQEAIADLPSYETLAKQAWEELYDEGKIGEYLAVPVYYCSSCHGPGTARMYPTSLDDANAVWVPGKNEIANMNFEDCVTHADKFAVAVKYAEGCLDTYEKWCNGECYGVVVERFTLEGDSYVYVDSDSVWGFIGQEGAEEEMGTMMKWVADDLKEKEAA